jgi:succinate dehydrogenase / fumarate reductase membrane anchor subunit
MNKQTILSDSLLKPATQHWLLQRISAIILIPLSFKQIAFLKLCLNAPYQHTIEWLSSPYNMVWILLWVIAVFYHAAIGLQVVIEDYVGNQSLQGKLIKLINISFLVLALASLFFMFRSI